MASGEHLARWEVATGLPIRRAYLDDQYVLFVARIPSGAIFAGARERGLLRESMQGVVPDSVRYRTDKARPFHGFAESFAAAGGIDAVRDLISMEELNRLGIVDRRLYRTCFERFAADPLAHPAGWHSLWGAITAEAYVRWFQRFNTRTSDSALLQEPV
jgi:hypothetical protein